MQYSGRKSVEIGIGRAEVMVAFVIATNGFCSDDIMRSNYHMESQLSVLGKVSLLKDTFRAVQKSVPS